MDAKRRKQVERDLERAERMKAAAVNYPTTYTHWSNRAREYREMLETGTERVRHFAF
jgi:hypothetical protein